MSERERYRERERKTDRYYAIIITMGKRIIERERERDRETERQREMRKQRVREIEKTVSERRRDREPYFAFLNCLPAF